MQVKIITSWTNLFGWLQYEIYIKGDRFRLIIFAFWGGGFHILPAGRYAHFTSDVPTLSSHFCHLPLISPLRNLTVTRLCLALYEGTIWLDQVSLRSGKLLRYLSGHCPETPESLISQRNYTQTSFCLRTLNILQKYFSTYMTNWD
jgi:hypothetical protein